MRVGGGGAGGGDNLVILNESSIAFLLTSSMYSYNFVKSNFTNQSRVLCSSVCTHSPSFLVVGTYT